MKNLTTILFLFITTVIYSQHNNKSEVGIKAGGIVPVPTKNIDVNFGNGRLREIVGMYGKLNNRSVSLIIELFYSNIYFSRENWYMQIHTFNAPIAIESTFNKYFLVHFGFNSSLNFSVNKDSPYIDQQEDNWKIHPYNIGLMGGFEVKPFRDFGIQTRFNYDLLTLSSNYRDIENKKSPFKYSTVSLSLNYTLRKF